MLTEYPTGERALAPDRSQSDRRRVFVADVRHDPRWERFVAAHPEGTIFHHPAWLEVLRRAYGMKPIGLACEDGDGQLRGILPLVRSRGILTGSRLASLPRTQLAGPLAADRAALGAVLEAAVELAEAGSGTRLELRTRMADLDGLAPGLGGAPWEQTYVLDLPDRPEEIRFGNSRNHSRIKWAVSKAARLGVEVRPAESEHELRAWYGLYLEAMRSHVVPPRPYRFFQACWTELRPRGLLRLLLAEQVDGERRKLLAGSLLLMHGRTVFYAFNGRRRDDLALRPNDALQWRAIHDACRDGYRRYDFGAVVGDNHGLADFKSKWGAAARQVFKYGHPSTATVATATVATGAGRTSSRDGAPDAAADGTGARARRLADAAWRRLPLRATAVVGDLIYKCV